MYLRKDKSLEALPFGISLDKTEEALNQEESSVSIHAIKILQKTLHTSDSYQVFEVFKQSEEKSGRNFGVFALNTSDLKGVEPWQPDLVISKYASDLLKQTVANEMDPNLVLIRLGDTSQIASETKSSTPITSVQSGDSFFISFHRADYEKKREAQNYSRAGSFEDFDNAVKIAEEEFDKRFRSIFFNDSREAQNSD